MKKVYIRTFGCQMNERDSEFITGLFLEKGYKLLDSPDDADVVLFNTCSVRTHAEERAISNMGELLKAAGRKRQEQGKTGRKAQVFGIVAAWRKRRRTGFSVGFRGLI